jgi:hypothetical protein
MWSSQSSSSQSSKKSTNDSSADNSLKELSSDEGDDPPTPVNETLDESAWNEATDEPPFNSSNTRNLANPEVGDNHKTAARLIGPQQHSCCHCFNGSYDEWCSTSRVFQMQETTNRFPSIVAKRNYRACDHCGLACSPMYFEPIAHTYWDCSQHHHNFHPNFHYRKVSNFSIIEFY